MFGAVAAALLILGLAPGAAGAADLKSGDIVLDPVVGGLDNPVALAHAGDGTGRLFIVLQKGEILVFDGGTLLAAPFLDIKAKVGCCGEQGLLGLAFHPDYASNGQFYVDYTDGDGDTVIARYNVSADPNLADGTSEAVLLAIDQPRANHNGGQLNFGPDGYLYIALGDGGGAGDPDDLGQDLGVLLGKLLRIDVDSQVLYAVPPSNPFVGVAGVREEIWAYGLRNPWRFSFDRETGDLWIADVGQGSREEVDFEPAGGPGGVNYGWNRMEGTACYEPSVGCSDGSLALPVLEYGHVDGNCSITGGYRYRGKFPAMAARYFYADYCSGRLRAASQDGGGTWSAVELLDVDFNIPTLGEDEAGEIYLASRTGGDETLYRIVYVGDADSDGDGIDDLAELAAGRNPYVNELGLFGLFNSLISDTP